MYWSEFYEYSRMRTSGRAVWTDALLIVCVISNILELFISETFSSYSFLICVFSSFLRNLIWVYICAIAPVETLIFELTDCNDEYANFMSGLMRLTSLKWCAYIWAWNWWKNNYWLWKIFGLLSMSNDELLYTFIFLHFSRY